MFAEWNSVHLCLYNGLSRNAQRRVFVDCAALRFIIHIKISGKILLQLKAITISFFFSQSIGLPANDLSLHWG